MCEIAIDSERLKHFPKTVPMNIREAILIVIQALPRILTERKNQKAMAATDEQNEPEEKTLETAPVPAQAPVKRVGCRIRAEVVYAKKS